jgi:alkylated DNA repair dioxygenase AlkB
MSIAFREHRLDTEHLVLEGALPSELRFDEEAFERVWAMHPDDFHEIKMHGRKVRTPRWQQAYGADYRYTGNTNRALPVPAELEPLHAWVREAIDPRLNGLLLNWYDDERAHYIGKHRDSIIDMIEGAPIVTVSLGGARTFRIRPWRREGDPLDLDARDGAIFVMPYATNRAFTHEVPHSARDRGRRISITLRAFRAGPS